MSSSRERNTQVYIRGFSRKTEKSDLKDAFRKYGKIEEIQLKNGYGFVRYYNYRDANDAVKSMNKKCLGRDDDYRLTVEPAGGRRRERRSGPRGPQDEDECWYCHKKGHWKNECKEFFSGRRRRYSRSYSRERRHRRRSSYSRSSSSSSRSRSSSSSVDSRDKKNVKLY